MHSNNEVGTLQPIAAIAALARKRGVLVHTDAAQSIGKVPVNVAELGVDLLTIAGHKLYAPKGIGVLYVRGGVQLEPLLHGAGHEAGRRAGTENVPYIVALGKAAELARQSLPAATQRLQQLRDRFWRQLQEGLGERVVLNGHPTLRLPNTLNVNFLGHIGAELLEKVPEIAASTGSACHEGQVICSPVLLAMGVPRELARHGAVERGPLHHGGRDRSGGGGFDSHGEIVTIPCWRFGLVSPECCQTLNQAQKREAWPKPRLFSMWERPKERPA